MKVAINLNTKTIVDILPDNATSDNGFLKANDYVMLDIDNAVTNYVENDEGVKPVFRALTDTELAPFMLVDINSDYENSISKLTIGVPQSEISTWTKQEQEARAYLLDNNAFTPFIDAICDARDVEKYYLVGKIIEKSDAYAIAVGTLTGIRQKLEKEISGE